MSQGFNAGILMDWPGLLQDQFAEKAIDQKKIDGLLTNLTMLKDKLTKWQPGPKRTELEQDIEDLQGEIIDLIQEAGLDHLETPKFTISVRSVPVYYQVTSKRRLISSLQRRKLDRFLIPDFTINMKDLKGYLLATNATLPGLRKISDQKSLYVFEKSSEPPPELDMFLYHNISDDKGLQDPKKNWKMLLFDLRVLGNSAYPALKEGKSWGDWTMDQVKERFADIIDILRGLYFPFLEPEHHVKNSWWELYFLSKPLMKSNPPAQDEVKDWDMKRSQVLKGD